MAVYLIQEIGEHKIIDPITIDCQQIGTEENLYEVVYPAIQAPEYAGHNLNAFNEIIRYIQEYFPEKKWIDLVFSNWNKIFINDKNRDELIIGFIDAFSSSAEHSHCTLGDDGHLKPSVHLGVYLIR